MAVKKCVPRARLLFFCVFVLLSSCGCDSARELGRNGSSTLNRGLNAEPESLHPHRFSSNSAANVLRDIGEGLLSYSSSGAIVPGVAESWSVSDDGLTYTFFLRSDAKWQNGSVVTASDFVSSFRHLVSPSTASPYAKLLSPIRNVNRIFLGELLPEDLGVFAIDSRRLRIELESPTAYFPQLLTHPSTFPIRDETTVDMDEKSGRSNNFVSNGAYSLSKWNVGSSISLVRNSNYWDNDSTTFDFVTYHLIQESPELNRYLAGDLDITDNVDGAMFNKLRKERPNELRVSPYLGVYYYGFNLTQGIFSKKSQLRRALSMAVDRESLVERIIGRGEQPAYGWIPPGINGYESSSFDYSQLRSDERKEEARRLYASAGYGPENPLKFELRYNSSRVEKRIALAIQSMWRDVLGAEVTLVGEEFQVLLSNIQEMSVTEMFRLSWTGDYNDPLTFLQLFETDNPSNLTGYSNSDVDAFLDSAASNKDSVARFNLLAKAESAAIADHPVIPLYFYVSKHLVRESVGGWQDNILDIHYSKHLSQLNGIE
jgi:ABC-type oligopeptide transport system substrate-binding subunit